MKGWRMRLNEIQTRFKDMMFDHPGALDNPGDFADAFESGDVALPERLKIYRNNVMGSLSSAVISNFPLIEKLVGREFLTAMTRAYILAHPPQSGCLTFYADDFDDFISTFAPAAHMPYLADVAKLEILMNRAYHAKDDQALSVDDLAATQDLENFSLKFRNGTHIIKSRWPLEKIRTLEESKATIDIQSGGVFLLVHRPALDVEVAEISQGEYELLENLKIKTLGEAVLAVKSEFDLNQSLPRFMSRQIFSKE
jgi:hypothetical protein